MAIKTQSIAYSVRRGAAWVDLDDVRWEVREEAESRSEDAGTVEIGGHTYRWTKTASESR